MPTICRNFDIYLKQCKYKTMKGVIINQKDLIEDCNGKKTKQDCCWYSAMYYDIGRIE